MVVGSYGGMLATEGGKISIFSACWRSCSACASWCSRASISAIFVSAVATSGRVRPQRGAKGLQCLLKERSGLVIFLLFFIDHSQVVQCRCIEGVVLSLFRFLRDVQGLFVERLRERVPAHFRVNEGQVVQAFGDGRVFRWQQLLADGKGLPGGGFCLA